MVLLKTKRYIKNSRALSKKDQVLLLAQEGLLSGDPFHIKLHVKKLKGFSADDEVYSFRVTRSYRGIFRLSYKNIVLFAIGHRKDIYQSF